MVLKSQIYSKLSMSLEEIKNVEKCITKIENILFELSEREKEAFDRIML